MLKIGLPRNNKRFCAYIKLIAKFPTKWDSDEIRTRVPNSFEQLHNVRMIIFVWKMYIMKLFKRIWHSGIWTCKNADETEQAFSWRKNGQKRTKTG